MRSPLPALTLVLTFMVVTPFRKGLYGKLQFVSQERQAEACPTSIAQPCGSMPTPSPALTFVLTFMVRHPFSKWTWLVMGINAGTITRLPVRTSLDRPAAVS